MPRLSSASMYQLRHQFYLGILYLCLLTSHHVVHVYATTQRESARFHTYTANTVERNTDFDAPLTSLAETNENTNPNSTFIRVLQTPGIIASLPHGINPHGRFGAHGTQKMKAASADAIRMTQHVRSVRSTNDAAHTDSSELSSARRRMLQASAPTTTTDLGSPQITAESILYPDYIIDRAQTESVKVGNQVVQNYSVDITFYLSGTAQGKVARLLMSDSFNHSGVLVIRQQPTVHVLDLHVTEFGSEINRLFASVVSDADEADNKPVSAPVANTTTATDGLDGPAGRRLLSEENNPDATFSPHSFHAMAVTETGLPGQIVSTDDYTWMSTEFDLEKPAVSANLMAAPATSGPESTEAFKSLTTEQRTCARMMQKFMLAMMTSAQWKTKPQNYIRTETTGATTDANKVMTRILEDVYGRKGSDAGKWNNMEINRQFSTGMCVMEFLPDGTPKNTESQTCEPDLDRPVKFRRDNGALTNPQPIDPEETVPDKITDGGLYETKPGTRACGCATITQTSYRSCTLNALHPGIRGNPNITGIVQKCMSAKYTEAEMLELKSTYKQMQRKDEPPTRQSYCVPIITQQFNLRPLGSPESTTFRSCGHMSDRERQNYNSRQGATYAAGGVATGTVLAIGAVAIAKSSIALSTGPVGAVVVAAVVVGVVFMAIMAKFNICGIRVCPCPEHTITTTDNSFVVSALLKTAENVVSSTSRLSQMAGDTVNATGALYKATNAAIANVNTLSGITAQNVKLANSITTVAMGITHNQAVQQTSVDQIYNSIDDLSDTLDAYYSPLEAQIKDANAKIEALRATDAAFHKTYNQSIGVLQNRIDHVNTQIHMLESMQLDARDSIQRVQTAVDRFRVGGEKYEASQRSIFQVIDIAQAQGWLPLLSDFHYETFSYGFRPFNEPNLNETHPHAHHMYEMTIDRSWVYEIATTIPSAYAQAYSAPTGTRAWIIQHEYEVHCALETMLTLMRTNITMDAFQRMIGPVDCVMRRSNNATRDGRAMCGCIITSRERVCPRPAKENTPAGPTVSEALMQLQNPNLNQYMQPLNVSTHGCDPTKPIWTGDIQRHTSMANLSSLLSDTCIGRNAATLAQNTRGTFVFANQENGGSMLHIPYWTMAELFLKNTTVAPITANSILGGDDIWDIGFLKNRQRTAQDWCTSSVHDIVKASTATGVRLLPQTLFSFWTYAALRFLGSSFLHEMTYAMRGRLPRLGLFQEFRAFELESAPEDTTDLSQPVYNTTERLTFPTDPDEFTDFINQVHNNATRLARPYHSLELRFLATGEFMLPFFKVEPSNISRTTTVGFATDKELNATGFGAFMSRTSDADVTFLNAQLSRRSYGASQSDDYSDSAAIFQTLRNMGGYLSCMFDHETCLIPTAPGFVHRINNSDAFSRGWYTYQLDSTTYSDGGRFAKQRKGRINALRTRVAYRRNMSESLSVAEMGYSSDNRRPIVPAVQYWMEEMLQPYNPLLFQTYMNDATQRWHTMFPDEAQRANRSIYLDAVDIDDPILVQTFRSLLLSPQYAIDPLDAALNPDVARVQLVDLTDRTYETDPNAIGVITTTPRGHPNVITRECIGGTTEMSIVCHFLKRNSIVRDPRAFGIEPDASHDPDRADTWKHLYTIQRQEQVSIKINLGDDVIKEFLTLQTKCPRNVQVLDALTSNPYMLFTRPSTDRRMVVLLNVTTATGTQPCDGMQNVTMPAHTGTSVSDAVRVHLHSQTCAGVRSIAMTMQEYDDMGRLTDVQECAGWRMSGAVHVQTVGEDVIERISSYIDNSNAMSLQMTALQISNAMRTTASFTEDLLASKMHVLTYASERGITLQDALNQLNGDGTNNSTNAGNNGTNPAQPNSVAIQQLWLDVLNRTAILFSTDVMTPESILATYKGFLNETDVSLRSQELIYADFRNMVQSISDYLSDDRLNADFLMPEWNATYIEPLEPLNFNYSQYMWMLDEQNRQLFDKWNASGWGCFKRFSDLSEKYGEDLHVLFQKRMREQLDYYKKQNTASWIPFSWGNGARDQNGGDFLAAMLNIAIWLPLWMILFALLLHKKRKALFTRDGQKMIHALKRHEESDMSTHDDNDRSNDSNSDGNSDDDASDRKHRTRAVSNRKHNPRVNTLAFDQQPHEAAPKSSPSLSSSLLSPSSSLLSPSSSSSPQQLPPLKNTIGAYLTNANAMSGSDDDNDDGSVISSRRVSHSDIVPEVPEHMPPGMVEHRGLLGARSWRQRRYS